MRPNAPGFDRIGPIRLDPQNPCIQTLPYLSARCQAHRRRRKKSPNKKTTERPIESARGGPPVALPAALRPASVAD